MGGLFVKKIKDFFSVYCMYQRHHPRKYAAQLAYGIAFRGLPF
jgi:hypothetical protein